MSLLDLEEARSVARAQAQESFEHFANVVLAARIDPALCHEVQRSVERNEPVSLNGKQLVLDAWLCVLGRRPKLQSAPTETFGWIFGDCVARHEKRAA